MRSTLSTPPLDPGTLAEDLTVSKTTLERFVSRFSPQTTRDNQFKQNADTLLFVHIPKTAGVSVGRGFQDCFDEFHGIPWNDIKGAFKRTTRIAAYKQTHTNVRQVIMGHFGWREIQIWRDHEMEIKCGTIFRDPVARTISNYNYNRSPKHPNHEKFKKRFPTLKAYARQIPLDAQLTQAVGFVSSFENALEKLTRYYTFLGITEQLTASLAQLSRTHGLGEIKEYTKNVGAPRKNKAVDEDIVREILERSQNDLKIHTLLTSLYTPG